jgi:hypothetical protein
LEIKFFSKQQKFFPQGRKARKERLYRLFFLKLRLKDFLGVLCAFARDAFSFYPLGPACPVYRA